MSRNLSRREMLAHGLGAAGLLVGGSLPAVWAPKRAYAAPELPDRSKDAPSSPVSIQRCESYEPKLVRRRLDAALDGIGGIGNLVRNKTVTVKLNLTGPALAIQGRPAYRTYHVHPNVVAALCGVLHDAGAKGIHLVEALYTRKTPEEFLGAAGWDLAAIRSAGGQKVTLENTKNKGRWSSYSRVKVPWSGFLFPAFEINQSYVKTDVFISLAKLKDHGNAGVTMAVKNLFGITPTALYGDDAPNENTVSARTMFHDGSRKPPDGVPGEIEADPPKDWRLRVPRVTADIFGARPVDLAVVDGIHTVKGGEGPWIKGVEPLEPKLLLAGRNGVCTDAVCAAVMGYDPQAPHMQFPFPGENHLRLLASVGVGTNDLKRIEIAGLSIEQALFPFRTPAKAA